MRTRWNPWEDRPIETAAELCMALRRVTNSDESRSVAILEIMEDHPRAIIFYSYDYELDILRSLGYPEGTEVAEWNGHKHQEIPTGKKWVYLVQYTGRLRGLELHHHGHYYILLAAVFLQGCYAGGRTD